MSDATHDSAEEAFHEIHLSGKQLVFLFMATTVVSVVIFLCGVLVGRGVRVERGEAADPSTLSAAPAPAPTDTVADTGPPAAEPPAPPESDELSYKKRLEGQGAAPEQLKPQAPQAAAPPPEPVQAAPARPEPQPVPAAGRPGTWVVQVIATRDRPTAATLVQRLAKKGYPAFLVNPVAGAPAPMFKVQVGRFNDRREADDVARRLEKEEQFKPWISR